MKRILTLGFLLMGFSFTVTQGLLIRELIVAFFGNELSIGLILGSWLVLEAAGSALLGRLADRWGRHASSFAVLQALFALFLPLCLFGAYTSRSIVGAIPGEGVGLVPIFYASVLILLPLGLVDGAMFSFGCRSYAYLTGEGAPSAGRVYVYESVGAVAGGIVFTYLMIPFLLSLQIALTLSSLNLLVALAMLTRSLIAGRRRGQIAAGVGLLTVMLIACLGFLVSPAAAAAQHWAAGRQWAGHDLVFSENSVYGNVAVVERESQYTFFADGIPIVTAPVPDIALSEEMVHLPMLFVPEPRRALVLSGGVGGVLHELTKYPLERIDYAELDPLLIEAVQQFPTPLTSGELADPRVNVEYVDGRLLVRQRSQQSDTGAELSYDLVLVNLPYPSTLQLNRFYTVEFFEMVGQLLAPDGILVTSSPGTLTYMSDELRNLSFMSYATLREVFPTVRPIPGDLTLWLASPGPELATVSLDSVIERWEDRALETQLVTPAHIRQRLDPKRVEWFWASLGTGAGQPGRSERRGEHVNRDLHPRGLLYGLTYWNALFSPGIARFFSFTERLNLQMLGVPVVVSALMLLAVVRMGRGSRVVVPIVIATTGFAGMTADLVVVFAFQTLYGHVFQWIGLLITSFMAGVGAGGWLVTRRLARIRDGRNALLKLEASLVLYWGLLPLALGVLYGWSGPPIIVGATQAVLFLVNVLAGFLVGSQFPLANKMWLRGAESGGTAGVLYGSDLVGAFWGSIMVAVVLFPVLGILETCLLIAILKACSLLLVATEPRAP